MGVKLHVKTKLALEPGSELHLFPEKDTTEINNKGGQVIKELSRFPTSEVLETVVAIIVGYIDLGLRNQ